jgi:antitoxin component of MazEF toxin-antitoxin module
MARVRSIGRVVKNGNSLQLSIPRPMLHQLGWHIGTTILLELRDGCLVVAELDSILEERAHARMAQPLPPIAEARS